MTLVLLAWLLGRRAGAEAAGMVAPAISAVFSTIVALTLLDPMGAGATTGPPVNGG